MIIYVTKTYFFLYIRITKTHTTLSNWCSNTLSVNGSEKEIERFKKAVHGDFEIAVLKKGVQKAYDNYMSADKYVDNLKEYVRLKKMSVDKLFKTQLHYIKDKDGNYGEIPSILSFNKLVPCPNELLFPDTNSGKSKKESDEINKQNKKKYGHANSYEWFWANWGTKWDVNCDATCLTETPTSLFYSFETAWSPPVEWLEKVCAIFPLLEFELEYEEGGVGLQGRATGSNGCLNNETWDYEYNDDEEYN